ncbi:MAG: hypothetical protein AABZ15_05595 [Nitrospirota bacterium]
MNTRDKPLLTDTYETIDAFIPDNDSIYIFGTAGEERCAHYSAWECRLHGVDFVRIVRQEASSFVANYKEIDYQILLRNTSQIEALLKVVGERVIYLDITGLSHNIWAPLLRNALALRKQVLVVYVEPEIYSFSAAPKEGEIFDLSERILGISPLPGFISFREPLEEEKVCFVPLLGFEGTRLAYLIEQVQPPGNKILPIIGVPGFRPEYPFYAYHGNQLPLLRTHAYRNVRYAIANCPFSLFYALEDIVKDYPDDMLKIAPIGTKPHALGAVLFAIANNRSVELIYDHPIRKPSRTKGSSKLLVYHASTFVSPSI